MRNILDQRLFSINIIVRSSACDGIRIRSPCHERPIPRKVEEVSARDSERQHLDGTRYKREDHHEHRMRSQCGRRQLQTGTYHDESQAEGPDLGCCARPEFVMYIINVGVAQYYAGQKHAEDGRQMQPRNIDEGPAKRVGENDEKQEAEDIATWQYHVAQQKVQNGPDQHGHAGHGREPEEIRPCQLQIEARGYHIGYENLP